MQKVKWLFFAYLALVALVELVVPPAEVALVELVVDVVVPAEDVELVVVVVVPAEEVELADVVEVNWVALALATWVKTRRVSCRVTGGEVTRGSARVAPAGTRTPSSTGPR